jgi:hypothetical protein
MSAGCWGVSSRVEWTISTSVLDRRATLAVGFYNLICADNGSGLLYSQPHAVCCRPRPAC